MNEKIKELTDQIEEKVTALFESDKYKDYLRVMSKFSHYSVNNSILIYTQRPDASLVAGYSAWKNNFDRHVISGAKGIRIIQPCKYKKDIVSYLTDDNGKQIYDRTGHPLATKEVKQLQGYKVGYIFDISDTDGPPLPSLVTTLTDNVNNYEQIKSLLESISPVPIIYEPITTNANGYFLLDKKEIHIKDDLPQLQKIKTLIHEMAHSFLHDKENGTDIETTRNEKEVEAESVAFVVASYLGLDVSDYSTGYIAGWSKGKELPELKKCLEKIRETADYLITSIDDGLMQQRLNQYDAPIAYKFPDSYLYVEPTEKNTYSYTFTDRFGRITDDGKIIDEKNISEIAELIMIAHNKDKTRAVLQDADTIKEKIIKGMSQAYSINQKQHKSLHI